MIGATLEALAIPLIFLFVKDPTKRKPTTIIQA